MRRTMLVLCVMLGMSAAIAASANGQGDVAGGGGGAIDHKAPPWFNDGKLGIFIHWGPYSVPAYAPDREEAPVAGFPYTFNFQYAEWYWNHQLQPGTPQWQHHREKYGEDFNYDEFIDQWKAEKFDPDEWVKLFKEAGAKYFVLTSKHHDGFALYPSKTTDRDSVALGPKRDLVGDLFAAARRDGTLKAGLYYSVYEWYHPNYKGIGDSGMTLFNGPATPPYNPYTGATVPYKGYTPVKDYETDHQQPQMREIIDRYDPDVLWCDGAWDNPEPNWKTNDIIREYYEQAANRPEPKDVVVNNRCGNGSHKDFDTPEYMSEPDIQEEKWEATRGIGSSFGYNAFEPDSRYLTADQLVDFFVDLVSKNGNLLLNIGPKADGTVPTIMQDRLRSLGRFLGVNGQAIYGSKYWNRFGDGDLRYTVKPGAFYATALKWPGETLTLRSDIPVEDGQEIVLVGDDKPLPYERRSNGEIVVQVPERGRDATGVREAYSFRIADPGFKADSPQGPFPAGTPKQDPSGQTPAGQTPGGQAPGGQAPGGGAAQNRPSCLPSKLRVGSNGVGAVALRRTSREVKTRVRASVDRAGVLAFCVRGGGFVRATTNKSGRLQVVASSARSHRLGRVRPGTSARSARRAYPRARRLGRGLYRTSRRARTFFVVRKGKVRAVGTANRRYVSGSATRLRRELSRSGV